MSKIEKLQPINHSLENWDLLLLACGKIDDLIDLVNSQQEAIEKLERVFETQTVPDIVLPADDTHRTVTLRVPKGMRIGQAVDRATVNVYQLYQISDTDLQKALDEVETNDNGGE